METAELLVLLVIVAGLAAIVVQSVRRAGGTNNSVPKTPRSPIVGVAVPVTDSPDPAVRRSRRPYFQIGLLLFALALFLASFSATSWAFDKAWLQSALEVIGGSSGMASAALLAWAAIDRFVINRGAPARKAPYLYAASSILIAGAIILMLVVLIFPAMKAAKQSTLEPSRLEYLSSNQSFQWVRDQMPKEGLLAVMPAAKSKVLSTEAPPGYEVFQAGAGTYEFLDGRLFGAIMDVLVSSDEIDAALAECQKHMGPPDASNISEELAAAGVTHLHRWFLPSQQIEVHMRFKKRTGTQHECSFYVVRRTVLEEYARRAKVQSENPFR